MATFGYQINKSEFRNNKKTLRTLFITKKAEIIAWAIFFGVGVSYFVAALIIAIV